MRYFDQEWFLTSANNHSLLTPRHLFPWHDPLTIQYNSLNFLVPLGELSNQTKSQLIWIAMNSDCIPLSITASHANVTTLVINSLDSPWPQHIVFNTAFNRISSSHLWRSPVSEWRRSQRQQQLRSIGCRLDTSFSSALYTEEDEWSARFNSER